MKKLEDMSLEELWQLFPVVLKAHNPDYKLWYSEEKAQILKALQGHSISRISHIGSTSVEGLVAKPIVDILLEMPEGYDMDDVSKRLQAGGWILMQTDTAQETLDLNKGYTPEGFAERVYHLHIKPPGDWNELYFRDYLRQHPKAARQYERLKQQLKEQFKHNRDAYTQAKTNFVEECSQKAKKEYAGRYLPPKR